LPPMEGTNELHLRMKLLAVGLLAICASLGMAKEPSAEVKETLERFRKEDPSLAKVLQSAAGYAVFPSVKKGGLGIGGARGSGELIEKGSAVGKATLTQLSIGFQAGGQAYAELILFETPAAVESFRSSKFAFGAQVSAVAIKSGASANAKYADGVKVLTMANGGLMYEATVGGQKFKFEASK
jgi:lipid-binding SYLF domain-containing protein